MTEHGLKKVLVYFNLVSDARRFARELPQTLRLLRKTDPDLCPDITPQLFFAHGDHTPEERAGTFANFAAATSAILANSKLIAEGVDIPSVDAIVFADPTRSVVRCVQALGRALRLDVSDNTASLIVPVYIPPGADPENILGTAHEPVWAIATALASHDHRILERLPDKANRLPKETSEVIARRRHFDFTVHPERIARAMDLVAFDPRDATVSRSRRLGLAAAQSYRDEHAHPDVPADYIDPTGYTLGTFITTMRDAAKTGRLEADWIAELDALGMIWDKHDATWRARLAAPATTPTGAWLAEQRHLDGKDQLDSQRADALTALDPDWRLPHGADWHRKCHLLRAHLADGADPADPSPVTPSSAA
ncbi:Helicase associated domain protein [Streptomyces sp. NPDC046900]|uniref:Helicase associated domain protein n=1 Tax=Streptomyces sp. NPDC046900 TaxID=3155473 RepID=UPI0033E42904